MILPVLVRTLPLAALLALAPEVVAQPERGGRECFSATAAEFAAATAFPEIEARFRLLDELRDAVGRAAAEAGIEEPRGFLALEHDRATGTATHRLHRGNLPPGVVEAAHRRMAGRIAAAEEDSVVSLGIRLDTLPRPELPGDQSTLSCAPALRDLEGVRRRMTALLTRHAPRGNPAVVPVLRMLVTRDGEAVFAELVRPTGLAALDRALVRNLAPSLRFHPGTLGGVPVDVWVQQSLALPTRRAPPPAVLRANERRRP